MEQIILTNDDGFDAVPLWELAHALGKFAKVGVIAPKEHKSWGAKAITASGKKVRCEKKSIDGLDMIVADGNPADCTLLGIGHYFPKADLVVSGMNIGSNAGHYSAFGSGTVGAAIEAALHGVFGVAVSSDIDIDTFRAVTRGGMGVEKQRELFAPQAKMAAGFIRTLDREKITQLTKLGIWVLNINVPQEVEEKTPWEITSYSEIDYGYLFKKTGEGEFEYDGCHHQTERLGKDTDFDNVADGKMSVTPLKLRTDYEDLDAVRAILKPKK